MAHSPTSALESWSVFLSQALSTRLPAPRFRAFAEILSAQSPLPAIQICDLLLRPRGTEPASDSLDPRIPEYVVALVEAALVDVSAALRALRRYSSWNGKSVPEKNGGPERRVWKKSWIGDEAVMFGLTKQIGAGGQKPKGETEAVDLIRAAVEWATMLTNVEAPMASGVEGSEESHSQEQQAECMSVRVTFGMLILGMTENVVVLDVLQNSCPKGIIKAFSHAIALFAPTLANSSQPVIGERLELFRTQLLVPLEPVDKKTQAANDEINQLLESTMGLGMDSIPVVDLPIQNVRAGLYVYLNSLLVGRPITDDDAIFNYMHNRYQGDLQSTCTDLITASFDILANAIFRKESAQTTIVLRSFLVNKVPLLLSVYSASMFAPLNAEFCITQALSSIDTNAFPTFSSMFDESSSGNMFGDSVRQEFCFACCLHGLIPEESIERLLGEIPMQTLPAGGRYVKDDLVQQCLSDPERTEALLSEIEQMDGNVGAVSQAITEMIGQLCRSKETMSLKTLCTHLVRKPSSLDVLLLFERPATILQPLCELLDGWHHDEDLGEYQPVYEEFGGILLLVMTFVYRYNLSTADLGLQSNDSFVAKWLVKGTLSRTMDEMSDHEKSHLDVWIRGLFNAEGGGLGDEPMSACPPQNFYLLVPTLFHQIVLACSTNHLNEEGLRGGLEFLVDTFLLPSLVGAIGWLAHHLWESSGDSDAVITILQTLIQPSSIGGDASAMLASVLNIVAKPLEHSLRYLQRSEPSRQDIAPLSKALSSHLNFSRTAGAQHTELEGWTATQGGGLVASIRHTVQGLILWSLTPGSNVMPTSYTHRQILAGMRILGAKRMVNAIIEEVKQQTASGSGTAALDVAVALICAPDSTSSSHQPLDLMIDATSPSSHHSVQRRVTLREALQTEAENAPKVHKEDIARAEATIRLFRRVEAQSLVSAGLGGMGMRNQQNALLDGMGGVVGLDEMQDGLGMSAGLGGGATEIDDAIAAATAAGGGDILGMGSMGGMMELGDDDLLGGMDMKLDF